MSAAGARNASVRREEEELPRGLIVRTLLATLMVGTALCFATYLLFRERLSVLRPSNRFPEQSLPAPREIANVRQEVFQIPNPAPSARQEQTAELGRFSWVDRGRGLVRIPIETAMDLVARGLEPDGGRR